MVMRLRRQKSEFDKDGDGHGEGEEPLFGPARHIDGVIAVFKAVNNTVDLNSSKNCQTDGSFYGASVL